MFHLEVGLQVAAGRRNGGVAEKVTDRGQINPSLEQSDCATMTECVRAERSLGQGGIPLLRQTVAATQDIGGPIARELLFASA